MSDVVVVVPARDEESTIVRSLERVCLSLERAESAGLVRHARVEVVAHRCRDATAARARAVLLCRRPDSRVSEDDTSPTIGQVRDLAVRDGLAALPAGAVAPWVLSTDADTAVGARWVSDVLDQGRRAGATAVVGLAALSGWRGSESAHTTYQRLVASKLRSSDPTALRQHDHVYGANLGVRADAYLAVGGFSHVLHGEDQALVDALLAAGHRVLRTRSVVVRTSSRLTGRAPSGLAAHLAHLAHLAHPE